MAVQKKSVNDMFVSKNELKQEIDLEAYEVPEGYRLVRERKTARLQLLVREAIKDNLRKEAAALGVSMNDLCNDIFEAYFKGKE